MTTSPTSVPVWLIRAGRGGRYASEFTDRKLVAIGWPAIGDLAGRDRADLTAAMRSAYGEKGAAGNAGMLFRFANELKPGDFVLTPDPQTREIHAGRVEGPYEFAPAAALSEQPNVRSVRWERTFSRDALPKRILYQLGSLLTLSQPSSQEALRSFLLGDTNSGSPGTSNSIVADAATVIDAEDDTAESVPLYEELRAQTSELIRRQVAGLDGYETQDLVAGVLRAIGYRTQVATEGADGGIDVVASKDALGVDGPVVKVQVKARPNTRSPASDVRALSGLVATDERGVFVSTGGFTRDAEADARVMRITLIGMDRLVELLIEYYDRLDQDTASLVPLRRVWVPSS